MVMAEGAQHDVKHWTQRRTRFDGEKRVMGLILV